MMIQRRRSRGGLSSTGDDVNDDVDKIEEEGGGGYGTVSDKDKYK